MDFCWYCSYNLNSSILLGVSTNACVKSNFNLSICWRKILIWFDPVNHIHAFDVPLLVLLSLTPKVLIILAAFFLFIFFFQAISCKLYASYLGDNLHKISIFWTNTKNITSLSSAESPYHSSPKIWMATRWGFQNILTEFACAQSEQSSQDALFTAQDTKRPQADSEKKTLISLRRGTYWSE